MTLSLSKEKWYFGLAAILFILWAAAAAWSDQYFLIAIPFALLFFYAGWKNRDLVFYLLLFSIPLSFEYQFSSSLGTDIPDEILMVFVSFLFLSAWVYKPRLLDMKTLSHPVMILLLIMIVWTLVAACFSTNPTVSVKFLLAKCWYLGAFVLAPLLLFTGRNKIRIAGIVLSISMLLVTIITLTRHFQSGFSFATTNDAVVPFFRNHVNYSALLVCIVPVACAFYLNTSNKKFKWLTAISLLLILTALYFSYARGAWLALFAGTITYWLTRKRLLFAAFVFTLIVTLAAFLWIKKNDRYLLYAHDYNTTVFHKDFGEHLVATYKLKDVSTAERFYRWIAGTRMIKDNWLTGYGPNTFYDNYKGYTVPAYKTWVSDNKDRSTVHNYYLLTAIEQGIPGLVFLLLLLGTSLWYAQYLYQRIKSIFYRNVVMVAAVILGMIMTLNFLSDLVETDKIGSLFFLCISMLVVADRNSRSDPSPDIQRVS